MERSIFKQMEEWDKSKRRKPLILMGARQVGKTWLMDAFAAMRISGFRGSALSHSSIFASANLSIYRLHLGLDGAYFIKYLAFKSMFKSHFRNDFCCYTSQTRKDFRHKQSHIRNVIGNILTHFRNIQSMYDYILESRPLPFSMCWKLGR